MAILLREALDTDKAAFVELSMELSKFNRRNHSEQCKYDDFARVLAAVKGEAEKAFEARNEDTLILMAIVDGHPVGYAVGTIFTQEAIADNGTGRMGLFDQLFLGDAARGLGLGRRLIDAVMAWFKAKGITRVKLHAYAWNTRASSIYESYGFEKYVVSYEKFI